MISKKKQLRERKIANRWVRSLLAKRIRAGIAEVIVRLDAVGERPYKKLGLSQLKSDIGDARNSKGPSERNPDLNWSSSKAGNDHLIPQLYKDLEPGISARGVICKVVEPDTLPPIEPGRADLILLDRFIVNQLDPLHAPTPNEFVTKALEELDEVGKRLYIQWVDGQPVREVSTPLYLAGGAHSALTKACRERTGYANDELTPNRVVNEPVLYSHEAHRRYMEGEAAKAVTADQQLRGEGFVPVSTGIVSGQSATIYEKMGPRGELNENDGVYTPFPNLATDKKEETK